VWETSGARTSNVFKDHPANQLENLSYSQIKDACNRHLTMNYSGIISTENPFFRLLNGPRLDNSKVFGYG